jgi:pyridoxamine 5'-phosphate oxidase
MTREEIIAFINANPSSFIATIEGTMPRVRGILIYRADDKGVLFHTGTIKNIHHQLLTNPNAEFCIFEPKSGIQVRVSGVCELLDDLPLKREIVAARPFLKEWVDKNGYEPLSVFRMTNCTARVWTMATNFDTEAARKSIVL